MSLVGGPRPLLSRAVVPVDATFASWVAVEWCLQQLDQTWEFLFVVSVADVFASVAALGLLDAGAVVLEAIAPARRQSLETWLDTARRAGRRCRGVVTPQPLAAAVQECASGGAADLVVLANGPSHGRTERLHASMVRSLERRPPCPLLVLPTCATGQRAAPARGERLRRSRTQHGS